MITCVVTIITVSMLVPVHDHDASGCMSWSMSTPRRLERRERRATSFNELVKYSWSMSTPRRLERRERRATSFNKLVKYSWSMSTPRRLVDFEDFDIELYDYCDHPSMVGPPEPEPRLI